MSLNIVKNGGNLVFFKLELRPAENFFIFCQNAAIQAKSQFAGRNHTDDSPAKAKRRQKAGNETIGVQDDFHRARFLRTALISASISSIVTLSVPCSTDRR